MKDRVDYTIDFCMVEIRGEIKTEVYKSLGWFWPCLFTHPFQIHWRSEIFVVYHLGIYFLQIAWSARGVRLKESEVNYQIQSELIVNWIVHSIVPSMIFILQMGDIFRNLVHQAFNRQCLSNTEINYRLACKTKSSPKKPSVEHVKLVSEHRDGHHFHIRVPLYHWFVIGPTRMNQNLHLTLCLNVRWLLTIWHDARAKGIGAIEIVSSTHLPLIP